MSKYLPWAMAFLASVTSISFHYDAQGVRVELKRTQEQLAQATDNNFSLASACEGTEK